jgi:hypothetical protein
MVKGLLAKYRRIDKSGKEAVLAGNITPYAFPVSLKNRFSLFALIEINDFFQMFIEKVWKIERMFGLKLILADRDLRPHFTVQEGNLPENGERKNFVKLINDFLSGNALTRAEKRILGRRIYIDQLLLDKGNLLLVTHQSPFLGIRGKMSSFYEENDLVPCPLDITHSSISRIAEIPQGFGLNDWKGYHDYVCKLQRFVERNDLVLRIKGTYASEAYQFLTTKARD